MSRIIEAENHRHYRKQARLEIRTQIIDRHRQPNEAAHPTAIEEARHEAERRRIELQRQAEETIQALQQEQAVLAERLNGTRFFSTSPMQ